MWSPRCIVIYVNVINLMKPNMSLMKDFSYFSFSRQVFPLNSCNMLVGGSTLKETTCAYAFAVYTGPQTKLGQNLKNKPNKFSTAEKTMNKLVLFLLGLLAILLIILTVLHYVVDDHWVQREIDPAGEYTVQKSCIFCPTAIRSVGLCDGPDRVVCLSVVVVV